ncbi:hypothetical protein [Absidia glauca]|uniref:ACB domain-containing protein n=1 Tax=Absidia glauca TaxID=4829 RepID=A0A168QPU8_ABSGL|nr:hypothetical protein [Absidia glauca]
MVSAEFTAAAEKANAFTKSPTQEELLKLYALFKQANVGDVNTTRPGAFDFKGKAKWDAWAGVKGKEGDYRVGQGTTQEDAEKQYIAFVEELAAKQ